MKDPFDTLGLEPTFDLDRDALAVRHRTLSAELHPDRYVGRPASERRMALDRAIEVNEAFRALRDPIRRAEHLLKRNGVPVGERVEPKASPSLLMEMMEVREELAEARAAKDLDRIAALGDAMRGKRRAIEEDLTVGFREASSAEAHAALLPKLGELRYVHRFFEELEAIEDELLT